MEGIKISEEQPFAEFIGVLTDKEQEEMLQKIRKHRMLQKELDSLKRKIMRNSKTRELVEERIDPTQMENWVSNLMKQFQKGHVKESYIQKIIKLAKEAIEEKEDAKAKKRRKKKPKKKEKKKAKEKVGLRQRFRQYWQGLKEKGKIIWRITIISLATLLGLLVMTGLVIWFQVPIFGLNKEFIITKNFAWFLSPIAFGIMIAILWVGGIYIVRNVRYYHRARKRFRAFESFLWDNLATTLLLLPMVLFLISPYSFQSDNTDKIIFLKPSFLLGVSLALCWGASVIGGLRLVVLEKEYQNPYYTRFTIWSTPLEINLDGDVFTQSYITHASHYQVEAMRGRFEIQTHHKLSQMFLDLTGTAPLFVVSIITLVDRELSHYTLGPYVNWFFVFAAGLVFLYTVYVFFKEARHYHQVMDGLTGYYLDEYDKVFEKAKTNPSTKNVTLMDYYHQKIETINEMPRWPLGFAGKLVAIAGFLVEVLILTVIEG